MRIAITSTKTETHVYSRLRNAIAPWRIAVDSSIMRSLPLGAAITTRV
jgi:hypothetical protein